MQKPSPRVRWCGLSVLCIVATGAALLALPVPGSPGEGDTGDSTSGSAGYDRQINLVYTVNNLGYTGTCG